jgi:hypothetical protein
MSSGVVLHQADEHQFELPRLVEQMSDVPLSSESEIAANEKLGFDFAERANRDSQMSPEDAGAFKGRSLGDVRRNRHDRSPKL